MYNSISNYLYTYVQCLLTKRQSIAVHESQVEVFLDSDPWI